MAPIPRKINVIDAPELRNYSKGTISPMEGLGSLFAGVGRALGGVMQMSKQQKAATEEKENASLWLEGRAEAEKNVDQQLNDFFQPPKASPQGTGTNLGTKTSTAPLTRVDAEGNVVPLEEGDSDEGMEEEEPVVDENTLADGQAMTEAYRQNAMGRIEFLNRVQARVKSIRSQYGGDPVRAYKATQMYLKGIGIDPTDEIMKTINNYEKFNAKVLQDQQKARNAIDKEVMKFTDKFGPYIGEQNSQELLELAKRDLPAAKEFMRALMPRVNAERRYDLDMDNLKQKLEIRKSISDEQKDQIEQAEKGIVRDVRTIWNKRAASVLGVDIEGAENRGVFKRLEELTQDGSFDADDYTEIAPLVTVLQQQYENNFTGFINQDLGDGNTPASYMKPEELKSLKEQARGPLDILVQAIESKNLGWINQASNAIKVLNDTNTLAALRGSEALQARAAMQNMGLPPEVIMQWDINNKDALDKALRQTDFAAHFSQMSQGRRTLKEALGASVELRNSKGGDPALIYDDLIVPVVNTLGSTKVDISSPDYQQLVRSTYEDLSLKAWSGDTSGNSQNVIFQRFTDQAILNNIAKTGDTGLKDQVQRFAIDSFGHLFQNDWVQDVRKLAAGEHLTFKMKPDGTFDVIPKSAAAKKYMANRQAIDEGSFPDVRNVERETRQARYDLEQFEKVMPNLTRFEGYVRKMNYISDVFGNDLPRNTVKEYMARMGIYAEDEDKEKAPE